MTTARRLLACQIPQVTVHHSWLIPTPPPPPPLSPPLSRLDRAECMCRRGVHCLPTCTTPDPLPPLIACLRHVGMRAFAAVFAGILAVACFAAAAEAQLTRPPLVTGLVPTKPGNLPTVPLRTLPPTPPKTTAIPGATAAPVATCPAGTVAARVQLCTRGKEEPVCSLENRQYAPGRLLVTHMLPLSLLFLLHVRCC